MRKYLAIVLAIGSILAMGGFNQASALEPPGKKAPQAPGKSDDLGFDEMIAAIKATPGCLGLETAQTSSGKGVIFAWFENKKAALNWYNSDMHVGMMRRFFPEATKSKKAMAHVPDDCGPILAIASITLEGPPTKERPLPFKQIAIELYQPMSGGLDIGGTFAPAKLKELLAPKQQPK